MLVLLLMVCAGCSSTSTTHESPWAHTERTIRLAFTDPDTGDPCVAYITPTGGHSGGAEGCRCEIREVHWVSATSDETVEEPVARGWSRIPEGHRFVGFVMVSATGLDLNGDPFSYRCAPAIVTTPHPVLSFGAISINGDMPSTALDYHYNSISWSIPGIRYQASHVYDELTTIAFDALSDGIDVVQIDGLHWVLSETKR